MMNNHEENVDEEEDAIVEEYVLTSADLESIRNNYYHRDPEDEDGNALDNPAAIPFCLNIVSPSIRDIPKHALHYCRGLTDVRVLQGGRRRIILRTIGKGAFWSCKRLRRINEFLKLGGAIRLKYASFAYCGIEGELVLPSSVLLVGKECFEHCVSITSVVFEPSSMGTVVEIQSYAFIYCTELSSATLPPTLERIPRSCFGGCTALINVPIPPTVVELEEYAFTGCTSLPSMELPELMDDIGTEAFYNCTALTTVTICTRSFELRMGDNIFRGCTALTNIRTYPWHWGKLLSSMEKDANFLNNFFSGTLTSLASINLNSRYGAHILEAVKDQPSVLYRFLRTFQHQRFETNAPRTTMTAQNTTGDMIEE